MALSNAKQEAVWMILLKSELTGSSLDAFESNQTATYTDCNGGAAGQLA